MWVIAISIFRIRSPCSARFTSALEIVVVKNGVQSSPLIPGNTYNRNYELKWGCTRPLLLVFQRNQRLSYLIAKLQ